MIHGDLKGVWFRIPVVTFSPDALFIKANILIDKDGHARLADFGLLTIVSDPTSFTASSSLATGGTTRWTSPERLDPDQFGFEDSRPTKESDCYALGMVIYEVLSGQIPFAQSTDLVVMRKVVKGEHPARPEGAKGVWFTDGIWGTIKLCWAIQPENRPNITAVLECLEQVSRDWKPPPPQVEENVEEADEDDWHFTLTVSEFHGSSFRADSVLLTSPILSRIDWIPNHLYHRNRNQFLRDCEGVPLWVAQTYGRTIGAPRSPI